MNVWIDVLIPFTTLVVGAFIGYFINKKKDYDRSTSEFINKINESFIYIPQHICNSWGNYRESARSMAKSIEFEYSKDFAVDFQQLTKDYQHHVEFSLNGGPDEDEVENTLKDRLRDEGFDKRFGKFIKKIQKYNRRKSLVLYVMAIILILALLSIFFVKKQEIIQSEKDNAKKANIAITDFYRWIENNDVLFKHEYDSVSFYFGNLTSWGDPQHVRLLIKFGEEYRRKRDKSIDSMLIRMQQYDINSDTIKFKRRLPGYFKNDINKMIREEDHNIIRAFKQTKFDTL